MTVIQPTLCPRVNRRRRLPSILAAAILAAIPHPLIAAPESNAVDYTRDIAPLLQEHCVKCHGPDKQKSNLRLDQPASILLGGDSGEPVFVRGDSAASYIVKRVTSKDPDIRMPPKGEGLSTEAATRLKNWIDQGAKLPGLKDEGARPTTTHWSFQPVQRTNPPDLEDPFAGTDLDRFILAAMKEQGLTSSPQASRRALIRRLYLVMHGLPPSPAQVKAFLNDQRPDAWQHLVKRVLASPRYGERWGRHWLDVVRYADSNGFETNRERKNAYHFRDYVIQAFNEDMPYDQFIQEQIAGDSLGAGAATGFLVAGPFDIVRSPDISLTLMQRQNELDDMINTTGTAFLGLTLGCARCHNHKFDPVLQKDYYSLQAVFAGVKHGDRNLPPVLDPEVESKVKAWKATLAAKEQSLQALKKLASNREVKKGSRSLRPAVNARLNLEAFTPVRAKAVRFTILGGTGEPCLDELEVFTPQDKNVALGAKPTASGTLPGYAIHQLKHLNDGKYGNSHSWISDTKGKGWVQLDFPGEEIISEIRWGRDRQEQFKDRVAARYKIETSRDRVHWQTVASSNDREPYKGQKDPNAYLKRLTPEEANKARALQEELTKLQETIDQHTKGVSVWAGNFSQPGPTHRLYRGDPFAKREEVTPDALAVLGSLGMARNEPEKQRRLKLARWIANPDNPLTARVLVNRVWHYIFGSGIVATPSDFGANGVPPSHPELLDWLADELVRSGWSIKHIQKLILTSNTFRQSSQPRTENLARDAAGRYLWRFPPRRLEAEAIRDCILATSGALDLTMGGPGFYLHRVQVENVMHYFPKEKFGPPEFRRMVYLFKIRQEQDAIFGAFDCPDGNQVIPKRSRSNTPLQALNLFNSQFTLQQADLMAERLRQDAGTEVSAQVSRAFQLAYARTPDAFETRLSAELIKAEGLEAFCRALLNTSEFLFIF